MSRKINSTPKQDGFWMPGEHEKQARVWMIWPQRTDNWREGAKPAQRTFAEVANKIAKYTKVTMIVSHNQFEHARHMLGDNIQIVEMSNDDSWMRDVGPSFVKNDQGELRGVDWIFNAWGGLFGGLYFPWAKDDAIAEKTLELINTDRYRTDFVLEGGSIHVDGEGTCYTTEECLLHANRNPHLNKDQIEANLKEYLGVEKVIWLPYGVYNDETDGHVDNMLHVVTPGHVVLTWTDDQSDPQYERSAKALAVLESATDAKGRKIKVTKLHQPEPMFINEVEAAAIDIANGMERETGTRLAGSYANFLITNGAVLFPVFNDAKWDAKAIATVKSLYPDRDIVPIYAREILLGGGNIHCITQQEPAC